MIAKLVKALRDDKEMKQGYIAKIAMPFVDAHKMYQTMTGRRCSARKDLWIIANATAEYFVDLLSSQLPTTKGDGSYAMPYSIEHYLKKSEKDYCETKKLSKKIAQQALKRIRKQIKLIKSKRGVSKGPVAIATHPVEESLVTKDITRVRAKNPNRQAKLPPIVCKP